MAEPTRECDLVMKGGITSGVVYPKLILELAKKYRFSNIGGTSAGAIAAGFTAAAEYGRKSGGFTLLAKVPDEIQQHLLDLFQPHPKHRKTFHGILKLMRRKEPPKLNVKTLIRYVPLMLHALRSYKALPDTGFGLCPGTTQKGAGSGFPALTDWLNVRLERLAGRLASDDAPLPDKPLTFGDLASRDVTLKTVSTDLSSKNPVLLPFQDRTWMFREGELTSLLPDNVSRYLLRTSKPVEGAPGFFQLPEADDLPVLLGIRASLSFPVLFGALPLYRRDFSLRFPPEAKMTPQRSWLSDGGISSNFPIHLFDSPFPSRPTFGIALDAFDRRRHSEDPTDPEGRVFLPDVAGEGTQRPIDAIGSPFGFLGAIFNAARNWQDGLQSTMPGYRERIVHIALDSEEGGLHLEMDREVVGKLLRYGEIAGRDLVDFDFEEHRWRRFLTAYAAFEEAFESMAKSWSGGFRTAMIASKAKSYSPTNQNQKDEIVRRVDALMVVADAWRAAPLREAWGGKGMPRPRTHLKQVPLVQAAGRPQAGGEE